MKNFFIFNNHRYAKEKSISIFDLGFSRGYGIFDLFCSYSGKIFALEDHFERFRNSAEKIKLFLPYSKNDLESIIHTLLKKNHLSDARIKMILTKGEEHSKKNNFYILTAPGYSYPKEDYEKGIHAKTLFYRRFLPECKTLFYLPSLLEMEEESTVKEILFIDEKKQILEGSTSNFFGIKNQTIFTANKNILPGVTRKILLKEIKDYPVVQRPIRLKEIQNLDEAFITSSVRHVMPVVQIDHTIINNRKPGPITCRLMNLIKTKKGIEKTN